MLTSQISHSSEDTLVAESLRIVYSQDCESGGPARPDIELQYNQGIRRAAQASSPVPLSGATSIPDTDVTRMYYLKTDDSHKT